MTPFQLHRLFNSERDCPESLTRRANAPFLENVKILKLFKSFLTLDGLWQGWPNRNSRKWSVKNNVQIVHMHARLTVKFTLAMPCPCHAPAMLFFSRPQHSTAVERRPCCVNQIGKTHSKPLAARHGRGTSWARHGHGMLCVNPPLLLLLPHKT